MFENIEIFSECFDWGERIFTLFFSLYGLYTFIGDWLTRKVDLSIGSFSIQRKYYDVQKITNIVSALFYDGGQVPPEIRREILEKTCPKVSDLKKKKWK